VKAYSTRVGNGPFVTELEDETGAALRRIGNEFGATTGRPRRCGWIDLVALRYSSRINGFTDLALTKLDVLSDFDEIRACTSYRHDGKETSRFPSDVQTLERSTPVYDTFPGWNADITGIERFEDLPTEARDYISFIEEYLRVPATWISTGPKRSQTVARSG
jgi:adenylosuccinate synthase